MNKSELNYKINVEPAMFAILNKIGEDVTGMGISDEEFTRAVWSYADSKLSNLGSAPEWLWSELDRKRREAEALNTVEGQVASSG